MRRLRLVGGLIGAGVLATSLSALAWLPSWAAWTDEVHAESVMTAGTWVTTTSSTTTSSTTTTSTPAPPSSDAVTCYPADPTVKETCTVNVTTWDFWGQGYRTAVSLTSTSAAPFRWEVRYDLSARYGGSYPSGPNGPMFPGDPVPAGGWWAAWPIDGAASTNACVVSSASELPIVRVRGISWNNSVGGGVVVANSVELQARSGMTGISGPSC